MRMRGASIVARLEAHSEPEGNCIVWTGALVHDGYGRIKVNGKTRRAHRIAWEIFHGPIPKGMVLDHECENRRCIKLSHLRLVSAAENNARRSRGVNNKSGYAGVHQRSGGKWRATWRTEGVARNKDLVSLIEAAVYSAQKRLEHYPIKDERDMKLVELYGPIMMALAVEELREIGTTND